MDSRSHPRMASRADMSSHQHYLFPLVSPVTSAIPLQTRQVTRETLDPTNQEAGYCLANTQLLPGYRLATTGYTGYHQ